MTQTEEGGRRYATRCRSLQPNGCPELFALILASNRPASPPPTRRTPVEPAGAQTAATRLDPAVDQLPDGWERRFDPTSGMGSLSE